jgi:hypothetical protein
MFSRKPKKIRNFSIDPDQVLLDSQNRPGFNTQQFEGVLEQSIGKKSIFALGFFVSLILIIFIAQLVRVQIFQGDKFFKLSENNRLDQIPIFSERGVIFDRNNKPLAWNIPGPSDEPFLHRAYIETGGFGHLLGYVGYPTRDQAGFFWLEDAEQVDLQSESLQSKQINLAL